MWRQAAAFWRCLTAVTADHRLDEVSYYVERFRNLHEAGASLLVMHCGSAGATFISPATIVRDLLPVGLVICTHSARRTCSGFMCEIAVGLESNNLIRVKR